MEADAELATRLPTPGAARMASFDRTRRQFEWRRQERADWLSRNIAEVDIEEFTHEPAKGSSSSTVMAFELCGALPPTVSHTRNDVAVWSAIGRSENQAAKELIERNKAMDKARIDALVQSVRAPRNDLDKSQHALRQASKDSCQMPRPPLPLHEEVATQVSVESVGLQNLTSGSAEIGSAASVAPSPGARNWESRITDFYRRWEARCNEEHADEENCRQLEEQESKCQKVRALHFEHAHEKRQHAITEAAKRFDRVYDHKEYKQNVQKELDQQNLQGHEYKKQLYQQERERVSRARSSKSARESVNAFVAQQSSLAKTCNSIDLWKARLHAKAAATVRAEEQQEQRAACSARYASRRALQEAQKRKVDAQMHRKQTYLIQTAKEQVKTEAQIVRNRVGAELELKRHIKGQREELDAITAENMEAEQDIAAYERTLAALRDLAGGVRHGEILEALSPDPDDSQDEALRAEQESHAANIQPLLDAEPRILAALSGGSLGKPSPVDLLHDFPALPPSHEHLAETDAGGWPAQSARDDDETPWPAPCVSRVPTREAATPRSPARPWSNGAAPPLLVRPLVDLRQQVDHSSSMRPRTSPAQPPKKGKLRPDTGDSLGALRRIRRTGPLVRR